MKYNHGFTIAFTIETDKDCSGDTYENYPSKQELIDALKLRVRQIEQDGEVYEAVGSPYDTYEIEEERAVTLLESEWGYVRRALIFAANSIDDEDSFWLTNESDYVLANKLRRIAEAMG